MLHTLPTFLCFVHFRALLSDVGHCWRQLYTAVCRLVPRPLGDLGLGDVASARDRSTHAIGNAYTCYYIIHDVSTIKL